jgi:hypothetical protein
MQKCQPVFPSNPEPAPVTAIDHDCPAVQCLRRIFVIAKCHRHIPLSTNLHAMKHAICTMAQGDLCKPAHLKYCTAVCLGCPQITINLRHIQI